MATKTLTIMDDAYDILKEHKLEGESFTEEIRRIFSLKVKKPLIDFFGTIPDDDGDKAINVIDVMRKYDLERLKENLRLIK